VERSDIVPLLVFGGGGAFCGIVIAVLCRRTQHPYLQTAFASLIGAPATVLFILAVGGAVASIERFGFNPGRAILAAIGTVFMLMFSLSVVCGIPGVIAGLITQSILQHGKIGPVRYSLCTLLVLMAVVPPILAVLAWLIRLNLMSL
jgi:hypothetical protein